MSKATKDGLGNLVLTIKPFSDEVVEALRVLAREARSSAEATEWVQCYMSAKNSESAYELLALRGAAGMLAASMAGKEDREVSDSTGKH